jgi:type III pantothenate kinase
VVAPAGGTLAPGGPWLLIGNSRWHWARRVAGELRCWHEPPTRGLERLLQDPPQRWAAVGAVPSAAGLVPQRRLALAQVPLAGMPPWLGIDRALVGWWAWRAAAGRGAAAVLVADAGTVLSLTLVQGGRFAGGRLLAGAGLQWRAMAAGTVGLSELPPELVADPERSTVRLTRADGWPALTGEAMAVGVREGLAAAIVVAWRPLAAERSTELWLTGGDGPLLAPAIEAHLADGGEPGGQGSPAVVHQAPDLALTALAALS